MKHHIFQFVRFGIVGVGNTVIDFLVYYALTRGFTFFEQHQILAAVVAFLIAGLNGFFWSKHWTFKVKEKYRHAQLVRFYVAAGAALAINTGVLWILLDHLRMYDLIAKLIASMAAGVFNFALQKFWAFGIPKSQDELLP